MNRTKRLLLSALFGILTPVSILVLALFLRAFRAPDALTTGVLWLLLWPASSTVYPVWCRFLPSSTSAVALLSLVVGGIFDALVVLALVYLLLGLFKPREEPFSKIPMPPSF